MNQKKNIGATNLKRFPRLPFLAHGISLLSTAPTKLLASTVALSLILTTPGTTTWADVTNPSTTVSTKAQSQIDPNDPQIQKQQQNVQNLNNGGWAKNVGLIGNAVSNLLPKALQAFGGGINQASVVGANPGGYRPLLAGVDYSDPAAFSAGVARVVTDRYGDMVKIAAPNFDPRIDGVGLAQTMHPVTPFLPDSNGNTVYSIPQEPTAQQYEQVKGDIKLNGTVQQIQQSDHDSASYLISDIFGKEMIADGSEIDGKLDVAKTDFPTIEKPTADAANAIKNAYKSAWDVAQAQYANNNDNSKDKTSADASAPQAAFNSAMDTAVQSAKSAWDQYNSVWGRYDAANQRLLQGLETFNSLIANAKQVNPDLATTLEKQKDDWLKSRNEDLNQLSKDLAGAYKKLTQIKSDLDTLQNPVYFSNLANQVKAQASTGQQMQHFFNGILNGAKENFTPALLIAGGAVLVVGAVALAVVFPPAAVVSLATLSYVGVGVGGLSAIGVGAMGMAKGDRTSAYQGHLDLSRQLDAEAGSSHDRMSNAAKTLDSAKRRLKSELGLDDSDITYINDPIQQAAGVRRDKLMGLERQSGDAGSSLSDVAQQLRDTSNKRQAQLKAILPEIKKIDDLVASGASKESLKSSVKTISSLMDNAEKQLSAVEGITRDSKGNVVSDVLHNDLLVEDSAMQAAQKESLQRKQERVTAGTRWQNSLNAIQGKVQPVDGGSSFDWTFGFGSGHQNSSNGAVDLSFLGPAKAGSSVQANPMDALDNYMSAMKEVQGAQKDLERITKELSYYDQTHDISEFEKKYILSIPSEYYRAIDNGHGVDVGLGKAGLSLVGTLLAIPMGTTQAIFGEGLSLSGHLLDGAGALSGWNGLSNFGGQLIMSGLGIVGSSSLVSPFLSSSSDLVAPSLEKLGSQGFSDWATTTGVYSSAVMDKDGNLRNAVTNQIIQTSESAWLKYSSSKMKTTDLSAVLGQGEQYFDFLAQQGGDDMAAGRVALGFLKSITGTVLTAAKTSADVLTLAGVAAPLASLASAEAASATAKASNFFNTWVGKIAGLHYATGLKDTISEGIDAWNEGDLGKLVGKTSHVIGNVVGMGAVGLESSLSQGVYSLPKEASIGTQVLSLAGRFAGDTIRAGARMGTEVLGAFVGGSGLGEIAGAQMGGMLYHGVETAGQAYNQQIAAMKNSVENLDLSLDNSRYQAGLTQLAIQSYLSGRSTSELQRIANGEQAQVDLGANDALGKTLRFLSGGSSNSMVDGTNEMVRSAAGQLLQIKEADDLNVKRFFQQMVTAAKNVGEKIGDLMPQPGMFPAGDAGILGPMHLMATDTERTVDPNSATKLGTEMATSDNKVSQPRNFAEGLNPLQELSTLYKATQAAKVKADSPDATSHDIQVYKDAAIREADAVNTTNTFRALVEAPENAGLALARHITDSVTPKWIVDTKTQRMLDSLGIRAQELQAHQDLADARLEKTAATADSLESAAATAKVKAAEADLARLDSIRTQKETIQNTSRIEAQQRAFTADKESALAHQALEVKLAEKAKADGNDLQAEIHAENARAYNLQADLAEAQAEAAPHLLGRFDSKVSLIKDQLNDQLRVIDAAQAKVSAVKSQADADVSVKANQAAQARATEISQLESRVSQISDALKTQEPNSADIVTVASHQILAESAHDTFETGRTHTEDSLQQRIEARIQELSQAKNAGEIPAQSSDNSYAKTLDQANKKAASTQLATDLATAKAVRDAAKVDALEAKHPVIQEGAAAKLAQAEKDLKAQQIKLKQADVSSVQADVKVKQAEFEGIRSQIVNTLETTPLAKLDETQKQTLLAQVQRSRELAGVGTRTSAAIESSESLFKELNTLKTQMDANANLLAARSSQLTSQLKSTEIKTPTIVQRTQDVIENVKQQRDVNQKSLDAQKAKTDVTLSYLESESSRLEKAISDAKDGPVSFEFNGIQKEFSSVDAAREVLSAQKLYIDALAAARESVEGSLNDRIALLRSISDTGASTIGLAEGLDKLTGVKGDLADHVRSMLQEEIDFVKILDDGADPLKLAKARREANDTARDFKSYVRREFLTPDSSGRTRYAHAVEAAKTATTDSTAPWFKTEAGRKSFMKNLFGKEILNEAEALAMSELLLNDPAIAMNTARSGGLKTDQIRMILHNLHGNIATLAMGGGKTYVYSAVVGIRSAMGEEVNAHIIVSNTQEIKKFVRADDPSDPGKAGVYRNLMEAMGIDYIFDAQKPFEESKHSHYSSLNDEFDHAEGGKKNIVAVFDLNTYGHTIRAIKDPAEVALRNRVNEVTDKLIDEADVGALLAQNFSVGTPKDASDSLKEDLAALHQRLVGIEYVKPENFNMRDESSMKFTLDDQGSIVYNDAVYNRITMGKKAPGSGMRYTAGNITEALRGINDYATKKVAADSKGEISKTDAMGDSWGTKDQSDFYSVAADAARMSAEENNGNVLGPLDAKKFVAHDIKLTSHGTEATIGEAFTKRDLFSVGGLKKKAVRVAGGSGTFAGAEAIGESVYGVKRVVAVEDVTYADFKYTGHILYTDASGQRMISAFDRVSKRFESGVPIDKFVVSKVNESFGKDRGFLAIMESRDSLRSTLETFIRNQMGKVNATPEEYAEVKRIFDETGNLHRISREKFATQETKGYQSVLDRLDNAKGENVRLAASLVEVADRSTDPNLRESGIASRIAREKIFNLSEKVFGRAIDVQGNVDEFREKPDNRGDFLQELGRTGRTGRAGRDNSGKMRWDTERHVGFDIEEIATNASRYQRMRQYAERNNLTSLLNRLDTVDGFDTLAKKATKSLQSIDQDQLLKLSRLNSDFALLEKASGSVRFRLSSEPAVKLGREPLDMAMLALAGSPVYKMLDGIKTKLKEGRYNNSRNTYEQGKFRSPDDIAKDLVRSGLDQALAMWREISENTEIKKLVPEFNKEALARVLDIVETRARLDQIFESPLREGAKRAFADIDPTIKKGDGQVRIHIAEDVVDVARSLKGQLLPSESSTTGMSDTRVVVEAARIIDKMNGPGGTSSIQARELEGLIVMARQSVRLNPRSQNSLVANLAMVPEGNPALSLQALNPYLKAVPGNSGAAGVPDDAVTGTTRRIVQMSKHLRTDIQDARAQNAGWGRSIGNAVSQIFQAKIDETGQFQLAARQLTNNPNSPFINEVILRQIDHNPQAIENAFNQDFVRRMVRASEDSQLSKGVPLKEAAVVRAQVESRLNHYRKLATVAPRSDNESGPGYVIKTVLDDQGQAVRVLTIQTVKDDKGVSRTTSISGVRMSELAQYAVERNAPVILELPKNTFPSDDFAQAAQRFAQQANETAGRPLVFVKYASDKTALANGTDVRMQVPSTGFHPISGIADVFGRVFGRSNATPDRGPIFELGKAYEAQKAVTDNQAQLDQAKQENADPMMAQMIPFYEHQLKQAQADLDMHVEKLRLMAPHVDAVAQAGLLHIPSSVDLPVRTLLSAVAQAQDNAAAAQAIATYRKDVNDDHVSKLWTSDLPLNATVKAPSVGMIVHKSITQKMADRNINFETILNSTLFKQGLTDRALANVTSVKEYRQLITKLAKAANKNKDIFILDSKGSTYANIQGELSALDGVLVALESGQMEPYKDQFIFGLRALVGNGNTDQTIFALPKEFESLAPQVPDASLGPIRILDSKRYQEYQAARKEFHDTLALKLEPLAGLTPATHTPFVTWKQLLVIAAAGLSLASGLGFLPGLLTLLPIIMMSIPALKQTKGFGMSSKKQWMWAISIGVLAIAATVLITGIPLASVPIIMKLMGLKSGAILVKIGFTTIFHHAGIGWTFLKAGGMALGIIGKLSMVLKAGGQIIDLLFGVAGHDWKQPQFAAGALTPVLAAIPSDATPASTDLDQLTPSAPATLWSRLRNGVAAVNDAVPSFIRRPLRIATLSLGVPAFGAAATVGYERLSDGGLFATGVIQQLSTSHPGFAAAGLLVAIAGSWFFFIKDTPLGQRIRNVNPGDILSNA